MPRTVGAGVQRFWPHNYKQSFQMALVQLRWHIQVFAHRFGLFLLHLLPGPKMPLATKLNPDRASDALTDDPFGTQSH